MTSDHEGKHNSTAFSGTTNHEGTHSSAAITGGGTGGPAAITGGGTGGPAAIVGGGACGLAAALALADAGIPVTVYEASPAIGGLSTDSEAGGSRVERIYHHMFTSDKELLCLFERFGLLDSLKWYEPANAIYKDGKLHPFTSPADLLRFSAMTFSARVRTGAMVLLARLWKDPWKLDRMTARDWLVRHGGKTAYACLWEPLLRSKFDQDAEQVSGTWIWNKFKLRGASRAKGISRESLGYPDGGFMPLLERMAQAVREAGGTIRTGVRVCGIQQGADGGFTLSLEENAAGGLIHAKKHCSQLLFTSAPETLPPLLDDPLRTRMLQQPAAQTAFGPDSIRHKANLCLRLSLKNSLSPWYWTTVADPEIPFVVMVEHTRLTGTGPYGSHLVYLSRYLAPADPLYAASDEFVKHAFLKGLKRIFADFDEASILEAELTRSRFAQPVATVGSGSRRAPAALRPPGLFLASMASIWPEDRGLNYAVRLGTETGSLMAGMAETGDQLAGMAARGDQMTGNGDKE